MTHFVNHTTVDSQSGNSDGLANGTVNDPLIIRAINGETSADPGKEAIVWLTAFDGGTQPPVASFTVGYGPATDPEPDLPVYGKFQADTSGSYLYLTDGISSVYHGVTPSSITSILSYFGGSSASAVLDATAPSLIETVTASSSSWSFSYVQTIEPGHVRLVHHLQAASTIINVIVNFGTGGDNFCTFYQTTPASQQGPVSLATGPGDQIARFYDVANAMLAYGWVT